MIDGLIGGRLYGQPKQGTSKNGNSFATAKVRAAAGDGESLFVNVIAFDQRAITALLALNDGEPVALTGSLTPKAWTDKEGQPRPALDMVAAQVLTPYHVTRKRAAMDSQSQ
jgi:single-stranded DNA-binding protein